MGGVRLILGLALLALAPAGAHAQGTGQPLSVPEAELAAALDCPRPLTGVTRAPVLLIPGTNLEPKANFDWNYEPALDKAGIPWCAVRLPRYAMGDLQASAEYVVYALRRMSREAGRRVSTLGFSQGGMLGRWALKWWPDTRAMVEDLIGLAPSNHGTLTARPVCGTCPAAYWQQRDDAKFIAALNDGPETFAGIDYTVAYTHNDEVVTPNNAPDTASSPLRNGDGRIRNVALQDICPANTAEHLNLGSFDPVGSALAFDALTHDGPADPARIDAAVCSQPFMPGVDGAQFAANYARYLAAVGQGGAQADYIPAEPPLRCYVTATCPASAAAPATTHTTRSCTSRRRIRITLSRRFRRATVTIGSTRVKVVRRNGRLTALLDLRRRPAGVVSVRIRGVTKTQRKLAQTRRYRLCAKP
jgi:hypothetical protein